jgi:hypothetical protein
MASDLIGNHSEQMQTVGMAGIDRQNLPVEPFGFVQAPGLMMSKGLGEQLLNAR